MTVPVPKYAAVNKATLWLWKKHYDYKAWRRGRKRNPNCNENRRYRDDTEFPVSPHEHIVDLVGWNKDTGEEIRFSQVKVKFEPLRFDGPTYKNGLGSDDVVLSNWNWFDKGLKSE